jgi:hypothetical protein
MTVALSQVPLDQYFYTEEIAEPIMKLSCLNTVENEVPIVHSLSKRQEFILLQHSSYTC